MKIKVCGLTTNKEAEFLNENKLMITDEEFVMLKLLDDFLNEEELLNKYDFWEKWIHWNNRK